MINQPPKDNYLLHIFLFVVTVFTTTLAGAEWMTAKSIFYTLPWSEVWQGLQYSIPFLGILTVHEFGHYLTSRYYKISASLPYYIPMYLPSMSIGTMGAFIRIREIPRTRQQFFDIGIAGPLAGFIVAVGVLWYGFANLPAKDDIFRVHPEYKRYGLTYEKYVYTEQFLQEEDSLAFIKSQQEGVIPKVDSAGKKITFVARPETYKEWLASNISLGDNLLMRFFKNYVAEDPNLVPNEYELFHYPFLFAGYLALFFTALNLIPIGQLDGGHILYGLIGYKNHRKVSPILFTIYIFYGGLGVIDHTGTVNFLGEEMSPWWGIPLYLFFLYQVFERMNEGKFEDTVLLSIGVLTAQWLVNYYTGLTGYPGWFVFGFILGRVLGVYHPPALQEEPLSLGRQVLGWLTMGIFVICFIPAPFIFGK
ncbi:site-2 protease family protein [Cytophagaceae bacterium YF14B1]|uniref:Site-2 protease family protein n=1 Tax=Xanthocytophaga flava TaxID=3048013 RepID=A0AAE3QLB5_9BACT|nr:site-2 protease family protein [Xanthocytophaga flavus]MDJ1479518.1 site-2 protease family protein [Xanthocytophaga flavus]